MIPNTPRSPLGLRFCAVVCALGLAPIAVSADPSYSLNYTDSFTVLDQSRWQVEDNVSWDNNYCSIENTNQWVSDGSLYLRFKTTDYANATNGRASTGAELRTNAYYTYGKFKARIKAASGGGLDTGFFLYRPEAPWQEIDYEFLGSQPTNVHLNVFYNTGSGTDGSLAAQSPQNVPLGFDFSADFHDYEIVWGPGYIEWWVDGIRMGTDNTNIPDMPMRLYVNIWFPNPSWWPLSGPLFSGGGDRVSQVDWVQYYQYNP